MIGLRPLLALAVFAASLLSASAQVAVEVSMPSNNFVAGEDIPITVMVTNHSSKDLVFQGNTRQNWIDFNVMSGQQPLTPIAQTVFGATKPLPAGQTMSRTLSLSAIYGLQNMGNFSVYATVRLSAQGVDGALSNRLTFSVYTPRPYWTQKIGMPDGHQREFRIMNYSSGQKTMLYAQVVDNRSGAILRTQSLGEALMTRKPSIAVDNQQVMHVLYQINPTVWGHARINGNGDFLGRDLQKPAGVDPQLVTLKTGGVETMGGVPYDPKAEAEARAKVRKATDRPSFLYQ
jgi:hypothetical protein